MNLFPILINCYERNIILQKYERNTTLQKYQAKIFKRYFIINFLNGLIQERPRKRVRLSGYGVELQIKSTEYKVQDDTQVKGDKSEESSEQDDEEDEIEGFNFSRLK